MAEARLVFKNIPQKKIGTLPISAFIQETHQRTSNITEYPVEEGANITDHIINQPLQLTCSGMIEAIEDGANISEAFRTLNGFRDNKQILSIVTGLKVYENMVIENLNFPRTATNGGSLSFTATFKEIIIVSSQAVIIPNIILDDSDEITNKQAQGEQDMGKTTSGQTQDTSFLDEIDRQIDEIFAVTGD